MKISPLKALGLFVLLAVVSIPTLVIHTKTVALNGLVGPNRTAALVLRTLSEATWTDHVVISVDSPGGYVFVETMIANAIASSHAFLVTADIQAEGDSAAAMISMDADQIVMDPRAVLGFHLGEVGDINDLAHATILSEATMSSPNADIRQASIESMAELKALPLWLFTDKDWELMNAGQLTYVSGIDMGKRMPMFYTVRHAFARDLINVEKALSADKGLQDYLTALHAELNAIQSFI